jgi:CarboxypepD_reg-like domain/TonB-dependent Receptor Plug Domain
MIKKPLLFFLSCFLTLTAFGQKTGEIRGFVTDKKNSEPIIFTTVFLEGTQFGISTDINGYFSITKVPIGTYTLKVASIEYSDYSEVVNLNEGQILTKQIQLEETNLQLKEVIVTGRKVERQENVEVAITAVKPKEILALPSVGGEPDLAQYIQTLPGVVFTGDQGGQLFIRGGSPVQNLIVMDGLVLYNPFHSIGLYSIFDTDILKNVNVYTGGFNAEYGGRTSAVIDVATKDGNKNRVGGKVSVNPFTAKAQVEGPIKRGSGGAGTSFLINSRVSYLDQTSKVFYPNVNDGGGLPFSFQDLFGKITIASKGGSKISFFGFNFADQAGLQNGASLKWTQRGAGAKFIFLPARSSVLMSGSFGGSDYKIKIEEASQAPRLSGITSANFNLDFTYFVQKSEIKYGIQYLGNTTTFQTVTPTNQKIDETSNNTEIGGFVKFRVVKPRYVIEPSVRLHYYASLSQLSPEIRLGAKYNLSTDIRFKLALGNFSQNLIATRSDRDVVNLFAGYISSPQKVQNQDRENVGNKLQTAWHYIGGIEFDLFGDKIEVNIEAYLKDFTQNINVNRLKIFPDDPTFITETGKSSGIDFLIKYSYNHFFLQGGYSYGWNTRNGPAGDGIIRAGSAGADLSEPISYGNYFPTFDRRHNINILFSHSFGNNRSWEFSARYNIGSGFPFTQTRGFYENLDLTNSGGGNPLTDNGQLGIIYSDLNEGRLPWYHRMDLSVKKKYDLGPNSVLELIASVINLYNRENLFYFDRVTGERVDQLPFLPSLGISWTF